MTEWNTDVDNAPLEKGLLVTIDRGDGSRFVPRWCAYRSCTSSAWRSANRDIGIILPPLRVVAYMEQPEPHMPPNPIAEKARRIATECAVLAPQSGEMVSLTMTKLDMALGTLMKIKRMATELAEEVENGRHK